MNAYISYVCSDNFIPGVVALYNSLRGSGCENDFLVLVTDDVTEQARQILSERNLQIVNAEKVFYNGKRKDKILDRYGKTDESWKMFTKLNIWKQTEYSKLIYLDADTLVLKNIDELFDINQLGAVLGGSDILEYHGIEGGVLVLEPNQNTYRDMKDKLRSDKYDIKMSDQSFLNDYFIKHHKINYISETFNRGWKKNRDTSSCHIFHFNANKPWVDPSSIDHTSLSLWRHFYEFNHN